MLNDNDNQVKILVDLGLDDEAKKLSLMVSSGEKDYFLYTIVKQYLKLFNFDISISISKSIKDQELKEFIFQLILRVYIRNYFANQIKSEIEGKFVEKMRRNLKRINEKLLPKFNQRIKVINLTLAGEVDKTIEDIFRIFDRDYYLAITIILDLFNLGNCGYRILLEILRQSNNNKLKQICYHLFRNKGGQKTKEKIKPYKSETTLIMINGNEYYQFKKLKENEQIFYERISDWYDYKIPKVVINQGKIINIECIRQLFLPFGFIVFVQPIPLLLKYIKKDSYLNKIPLIYPEIKSENSQGKIYKDKFIKYYQPSDKYQEKISGKQIENLNKKESNQEIINGKIAEMDENMSLFIEDMLSQL